MTQKIDSPNIQTLVAVISVLPDADRVASEIVAVLLKRQDVREAVRLHLAKQTHFGGRDGTN